PSTTATPRASSRTCAVCSRPGWIRGDGWERRASAETRLKWRLMASAPPPSTTFKKSVAREYLESLVVAFILATFIRTFIVQAFKIPTASMETDTLIGDPLLVNKVVYSPSLLPFEDGILAKKPIRRGHVVVFKYPEEPARDFIKRVIGLPGETV